MILRLPSSTRALPLVLVASLGCARAPEVPAPASGLPAAARVAPPARPAEASASAATSAAPLPAPRPGKAARVRSAALRFELAGEAFPSPLVDAVIAGEPTSMIVDTGATHHVVARWLADELSTPLTTAGDVGVDHAGHAVAVARLESAGLSVSGWGPTPPEPLLVVAVPAPLRHLGVGGFLSPQALAESGRAITLDLRAGSLRDDPRDAALARLGEGGEALPARVCAPPDQGARYLVRAAIDGLPLDLQLDTGAFHSSIGARSPAGLRLAARARKTTSAYVVSGRVDVSTVEDTRVSLGAFAATVDLDLFPTAAPSECAGEGFLGMDVLRSCVIVLAPEGGALRCWPRS